MPFGLCNAPATFEGLMEKVLAGLLWHGVLGYIDDIIAFGNTWEDAIMKLEQVMIRLRQANLKLKAKKCFLFRREVEYLGHEVSGEGVLRSLSNKQFVAEYSAVAAPLNTLTRKDVPFLWGDAQGQVFRWLKAPLASYPCLWTIKRHGQ